MQAVVALAETGRTVLGELISIAEDNLLANNVRITSVDMLSGILTAEDHAEIDRLKKAERQVVESDVSWSTKQRFSRRVSNILSRFGG